MGSYLSSYYRGAPKSRLNPKLIPFIPYLSEASTQVLLADASVQLEVRPSNLTTTAFLEGHDDGLFTKQAIKKGTIVCTGPKEKCKMNDAIVNLEPILLAVTSVETYDAWNEFKQTYYNIDKVRNLVNVRLIIDKNGAKYYEAIQDISAGGELLRMYGFTTWPFELFDLITNKNIAGFIRFIDELVKESDGDPSEQKLKALQVVLNNYRSVNKIPYSSLAEYDVTMANQSLQYLGAALKKFCERITG
jgi:hypothetical protein